MRRWLKRVWNWIFPPECLSQPSPSIPLPQGEGSKDDLPLWVDAGLLGMKPEIGLTFRTYPCVMEIVTILDVNYEDANWIFDTCRRGGRVGALVTINDVARAMKAGVPITEIRERGLKRMMRPAVWERK